MNVDEFVDEWTSKKDTDGTGAVGLGIKWHAISKDSRVIQFFGHDAWEKMKDFHSCLGKFQKD